jgi:carbon storage regulator CsrA
MAFCQVAVRGFTARRRNFKFYYLLLSPWLVRMSRDRRRPIVFGRLQFSNHHFDLKGHKMKVFSRRENEGLVIGDDVRVTVLKIRSGYVRLAIFCPRMTPAYWEETLFWDEEQEQPSDLELVEVARS